MNWHMTGYENSLYHCIVIQIIFLELEQPRIVGCVGGILRSAEDMTKITPVGKEYIQRENYEHPLWSKPLGIGLIPNSSHGAVELVRMAVHPDFRGKEKIFSVVKDEDLIDCGQNKQLSISQVLISTIAKWAIERNCKHIVLTTGRSMFKAVAAYKRLGFSGYELPENIAFSAQVSCLLEINSP